MDRDRSEVWMWSEALAMLDRAEGFRRQFFQPGAGSSWEPPVDVLEQEDEVVVLVALPGVDPREVKTAVVGDALVVAGRRVLPAAWRTSKIHRVELPQGHFERRVLLPAGRYSTVTCSSANGCIRITIRKLG